MYVARSRLRDIVTHTHNEQSVLECVLGTIHIICVQRVRDHAAFCNTSSWRRIRTLSVRRRRLSRTRPPPPVPVDLRLEAAADKPSTEYTGRRRYIPAAATDYRHPPSHGPRRLILLLCGSWRVYAIHNTEISPRPLVNEGDRIFLYTMPPPPKRIIRYIMLYNISCRHVLQCVRCCWIRRYFSFVSQPQPHHIDPHRLRFAKNYDTYISNKHITTHRSDRTVFSLRWCLHSSRLSRDGFIKLIDNNIHKSVSYSLQNKPLAVGRLGLFFQVCFPAWFHI